MFCLLAPREGVWVATTKGKLAGAEQNPGAVNNPLALAVRCRGWCLTDEPVPPARLLGPSTPAVTCEGGSSALQPVQQGQKGGMSRGQPALALQPGECGFKLWLHISEQNDRVLEETGRGRGRREKW